MPEPRLSNDVTEVIQGDKNFVSKTVDGSASLFIKKDDCKENFADLVLSAVYSTNRVNTQAARLLFSSFWDAVNLLEQEAQGRSMMQSTKLWAPAPAWQITPANFICVRCGKKVSKEIRIHEPTVMAEESRAASSAMLRSGTGWIPFCFDCILTHRTLKPAWLVID